MQLPQARYLLSLGMASMLTVGGLFSLAPAAGAQLDGTAYETEGGLEVTWDNPWEVDEEFTGYDDEIERDRLVLYDGSYQFIVAEFLTDNYTLESLRDEEIQYAEDEFDAEEVDSFEDDESASVLWTQEGEQDTFAVYAHVFESDRDHLVMLRIAGPVEEIGDAFESVTADVEIDGDEPFAAAEVADADIDDVVDSFDGGSSGDDGEETPEADGNEDGGDVDADEYLTTVQDTYDEWSASYERFLEILSDEDLGDAEIADEFNEILASFEQAPDMAAELEAPEDFADVQEAYEAYADGLAEIVTTLDELLASEEGTTAGDDAEEAFGDAVAAVPDLGTELEDALADAA